MSFRWQRTLDGWTLNYKERLEFYQKVVKVGRYYKKCANPKCENPIINKKNRFYCAECQREIWKHTKPFAEPILLDILLDLEVN